MPTKVNSNQRVTVFAGPDIGIDNWDEPSLADLQELVNVSGAINWDSFDFNLEASEQVDDRVLTDAAGAQSRQYDQFGGSLQFGMPTPDDTTSILRIARDLFASGGSKIAVAIRTVTLNSVGLLAGDEINLYRVQLNYAAHGKNDVTRYYTVSLLPKDDVLVNYIAPAGAPTAPVLTPSAAATPTIGTVGFITSAYQGRNVTVGGTWTSSNPAVLEVTPHGAWRAISAGAANVTHKVPGSLTSIARAFTVS